MEKFSRLSHLVLDYENCKLERNNKNASVLTILYPLRSLLAGVPPTNSNSPPWRDRRTATVLLLTFGYIFTETLNTENSIQQKYTCI